MQPAPNSPTANTSRRDLANLGRGFLMGGADIIPGVSGGTVALILGIYERLVTALSHFDLALLGHLRRQQWGAAVRHIDLRFLVALGLGILIGVGGLARVMHYLLFHHAVPTWSLLFGMILASSLLVALMIECWSFGSAAALLAGAAFAFWLVAQLPAEGPDGYWYLFLCGMIAICAMILPGISGAFILVLLGKYFYVTGVLGSLQRGEFTLDNVLTVVVFGTGCLVGLLSFSKLLRTLLNRFEALTMATLCGFMLGSLRRIWPFKQPASVGEQSEFLERIGAPAEMISQYQLDPDSLSQKYRLIHNDLPAEFTGEVIFALALAIAGLAAVILLDRISRMHEQTPLVEAEDHEPESEDA